MWPFRRPSCQAISDGPGELLQRTGGEDLLPEAAQHHQAEAQPAGEPEFIRVMRTALDDQDVEDVGGQGH